MEGRQRRNLAAALALCAALTSAEGRASDEALTPTPGLTFRDLSRLVARRAAALSAEQLNVEVAEAEVQQSGLPLNPLLDLGWGTIPVGPTNPKNLASPLRNVPNYSAGLGYTFLVGKRGARVKRAEAQRDAARAGRDMAAQELTLALARVLGRMAVNKLRQEGQRGLIEQGKGSLAVAKSRQEAGQGTGIDVDRLEIDLGRTEQQARAAEGDERAALAQCAALSGGPCAPFGSGADARAFLQGWIEQAGRLDGDIERRADFEALEAQRRSAEHDRALARASSKPDLTFRLGYLYDTFLISGNQNHSLSLQVSLPLPIFDRGQAAEAAAAARQARLRELRGRWLGAERARVEPLRKALESHRQRQAAITAKLLPQARSVLADLERAASGRLLAMTDVLQARRTISELLIDESDSLSDAYQAAIDLYAIFPASGSEPTP